MTLLVLVVVLALAALGLTLAPLLGRRVRGQVGEGNQVGNGSTVPDPDAPERSRLEAEQAALSAELIALPEGVHKPELENRAARVLRALDALPPAPGQRPSPALGALGVLIALTVVAVGAVSFVPRWQLAALNGPEGLAVQSALSLPGLQRTALGSRSQSAYLAWGDAAFTSSRYDQASQAYAGALKLDPKQPRALRRLGIMLLTGQGGMALSDQKQASQAFLLVRTAAQLAPQDPESQLLLGYALNTFGQGNLALAALERYRNLAPQGREADDLIATLQASRDRADPGARVYAANCASCHGAAGFGGLGPNLHESRLSRAALKAVILNGKGSMPAYPQIKGAELDALLTRLERWEK
ncbi:c-type cytochrome [Deinococcus sp.]|uniref:c-type cytochrome n=1 Tax=Deinococcus sp. TaxID=47478 RepID=UPI0025DB2931|nr:c-type cytochrome [Deinococcus sp.]